jgi:16S rRNA (adenine1518-N6/adenine1519-N6)-dimethyltransferase
MPHPRKQFAQHWLRSPTALNQIIEAAELSPTDQVLEIGPGTGILTQDLLKFAQTVVAVEIDRDLCKRLVKKLGNIDNFLLLQGDFLDLDLAALLKDFPKFKPMNKIVANIPYNITGPILTRLLGTLSSPVVHPYELIVLLIQKEVAQRLCATAGAKIFGALSVRVQYLAECELICEVPAKAFYPPPKVDSAVVRLRPRLIETPAQNPRHLEMLVKLGFANKRKMLRNNLKSVAEQDQLTPLLEKLNINPQARAEDLGVEQWVALSDLISAQIPSNV